jgi:transposase
MAWCGFQTKINNGFEGMNSLIQAVKARSRDFRNVKYFITMIYLIGTKLEFQLPGFYILPILNSEEAVF